MNRRNFLKLLGLTALPVPALAAPTVYTGNITVITTTYDSHIILVNGNPSEPYCRRKGHQKEYYRGDLGLAYQPMKVASDDVITVRAINDVEVSFKPQWSVEHKRFASVYIETTFGNENDPNYKEVTKLTAVL